MGAGIVLFWVVELDLPGHSERRYDLVSNLDGLDSRSYFCDGSRELVPHDEPAPRFFYSSIGMELTACA